MKMFGGLSMKGGIYFLQHLLAPIFVTLLDTVCLIPTLHKLRDMGAFKCSAVQC